VAPKYLRDAHSGRGFNFGVGVSEWQAQTGGKPPSDGAFSGAHHSDKHKRAAAERGY
jgi:hypothetical protein